MWRNKNMNNILKKTENVHTTRTLFMYETENLFHCVD